MESAEQRDWLPLKTDFDMVWRGWHPGQVQAYLERVESDLRVLLTDRDAAAAQAGNLAEQLMTARNRVSMLQRDLDRICQQPIDDEAPDERLRRQVVLAEHAADDIVACARTAAEHRWAHAQAAADRVKACYQELLEQARQRQQDAEAAYRAMIERANAEVAAMLHDAEVDRGSLDEEAEHRRRQIEAEFEEFMRQRRADDEHRHAEREAASKAEAARYLREAAKEAERLIAQATVQADEVRRIRQAVVQRLLDAESLLRQAEPVLEVRAAADRPSVLRRQACVRAGTAAGDGQAD
jgi:colicin import membrane protein